VEESNRILIVDDEPDTLNLLKCYLETMDFTVITASNGFDGIEKAQKEKPDLIILDVMMPGMDGFQVCKMIRSNFTINHVPILFLTCKVSVEDTIQGLNSGGDDYISKPFDFRELISRIHTLMRRTKQHLAANPLTNLPGNPAIHKEIERLISNNQKFAVCLFDIDNFKSFNDRYGYECGDNLIKDTSQLIISVLSRNSILPNFIGHIGGDDFIVTCSPDTAISNCEEVIAEFDRKAPLYYDEKDRRRGFIECRNRRGEIQKFPLVSLSVGVVTNESRVLTHPGEIAKILAELKTYAKTFEGSKCVKDRRTA